MPAHILVTWIGETDLKSTGGKSADGPGPIARALAWKTFDHALLLSDYPASRAEPYVKWLSESTTCDIARKQVELSSPMHFGEIYQRAAEEVAAIRKNHPDGELTFHLSPGTSAMAAVWIILSKTLFPAELIQSSKERGVEVAEFPFRIAADFLPDLLREPDKQLLRLMAGLPPEAPEFHAIIHQSEIMKKAIAKARRAAPRSVPILIEGASGTGKELLARAIHKASPRRDKGFVVVNCGAIPAELLESELFGHEKGAFTGAERRRIGFFEEAHQGTLFLDEVGELPLKGQVKLLRALQQGEIQRLGSTKTLKLDVRVIAATNRNLVEQVVEGEFREDLFHRLAVALIRIPPLADRPGDVPLLIDHLLEKVNRESRADPGYEDKKLSVSARNVLLKHSWSGNVRELLNTLRRVAVWSSGEVIEEEDVADALLPVTTHPVKGSGILDRPLDDGIDLQALMAQVATHYIERALRHSGGVKKRAAKILGLPSYQTLTNWMKKYGVES